MANVKDMALQLSAESKADAAAIDAILEKATADVQVILAKYNDVPPDVSLPNLSPARNVLASISMHFPPVAPVPPLPLPRT
jgi:hypothetical protein